MITEDYVSFETAKLLKEKEFDEPCYAYWHEDENKLIISQSMHAIKNFTNPCFFGPAVPTLQMAMKWVREVHGLNIYARGVWKDVEIQYGDWEPAVVGYDWFVESLTDDTYSKMSTEQFLTYEQACEAAIKYCLEKLI